jgi:3-hydroxyisobutyrate dehydrogenase
MAAIETTEGPATSDGAVDVTTLGVALVGYGEVGSIFCAALAPLGLRALGAFDVKIAEAAWSASAFVRAAKDGVALARSTEEAAAGAQLVISAVTAAETAKAASEIARVCRPGTFVLDVTSASPQTKAAGAEAVARAGGRYVEAAVMTSVPPYGIKVPMLLGGPHAAASLPMLERLGFAATVGSASYGVVSAIKLCRSVIIKGMEAIVIESLLSARRYGVEREVLASLAETFPGIEWEKQATYFWRRVVQHGRRRSEEMREAAVTVRNAGLAGSMASATADLQGWVAQLRADGVFASAPKAPGWRAYADLIPHQRSGSDT